MNKKDLIHTGVYIPCSIDELKILRFIANAEGMPLKKMLRIAIGLDDMPKKKIISGMIH